MAGPRTIIDWALAERVANGVAGRGAHAVPAPVTDLSEVIPEIEQRIEDTTGLRSAHGSATFDVVDRRAWIAANIGSFQHLLAPLATRAESMRRAPGLGVARRITGTEVGLLLGWMSRRVLGQYDLLVGQDPDGGPGAGAVYLVGENIAAVEQRFGFDPAQFRTWVLIHELTHRAQFTGVPWMRDYFAGLVGQTLALANPDPQILAKTIGAALRDRQHTRQQLRDHGLAGVLATPEQRAVIDRISGLMSLLEGHGDVVMTRAAGPLVADAARFERILQARRKQGSAVNRVVQQLLGIEAKLNQYAAGARFIAAVEESGGPRLIDRCWRSAEDLPSMDEIRTPQRWLDRVLA